MPIKGPPHFRIQLHTSGDVIGTGNTEFGCQQNDKDSTMRIFIIMLYGIQR